MKTHIYLVLAFLLFALPAVAVAGTPDPEPFFKRLESIGLKTDTIRKLTGKLTLVFRDPSDDKEAEYGYIRKRLYLPTEIREKNSSKMRFDLPSNNIDTLIHEYTHAYDYQMTSEKAPRGSHEKLFWDAWNSIRADITLNPDEQILGGIARYPGMKASEVCGYYMGSAIGGLFDAAREVVLYNEVLTSYIRQPGDAERLGDKLILPPKEGSDGFVKRIATQKLGGANMSNQAMFNGNNVKWPENRDWVKKQLYENGLGLEPPKTMDELVERLNSLDNDWIKDVRKRVKAAREAAEKKLAAPKAEAGPLDDDLRNR